MADSEAVAQRSFSEAYHTARMSRDHDIHKGVVEDGRPSGTTNAPGLDGNGLPNDETAIAEDALGAREDKTQG
jgi:hypothetical protein